MKCNGFCVAIALFACVAFVANGVEALNDRPVLGILTLPNDSQFKGRSYFPASYVKWLESGGARVVPIKFTDTAADNIDLLKSLNGALFTGGGASFVNPDGSLTPFAATGKLILDYVIDANNRGVYFPLWATCLGFEMLNFLASGANFTVLQSGFDSENLTLPLDFSPTGKGSRMMTAAGSEIVNILGTKAVTMNNHHSGVPVEAFLANHNLMSLFDVVSTNVDRNGRAFVSTIEGRKLPIYSSQWHPEKPQFEWWDQEVIDHSDDSIRANSFFPKFFVNEARKNDQQFANKSSLDAALIYNYSPVYTAEALKDFVQCYYFD